MVANRGQQGSARVVIFYFILPRRDNERTLNVFLPLLKVHLLGKIHHGGLDGLTGRP